MDGRSVAVAGGVSGSGSATAQRFAERGARVGIADLARSTVCTIEPGLLDSPMLAGLRQDVRLSLSESASLPARLGSPDEDAKLACSIIDNAYLNGATLRLGGARCMSPRY